MMDRKGLFIKICGITNLEDAVECIKAGADALGFVFYPQSPRYISPEDAGDIISRLPDSIVTFGVFVNTPPDVIFKAEEQSGIDIVQLHGNEPPEWIDALRREGVRVCKAFFQYKAPSFRDIDLYPCDLVLLESGKKGYGGTGESWQWPDVERLKKGFNRNKNIPVLLAGGVTEENVMSAIEKSRPDGIDLSSGVEKYPGKKDHQKVHRLIMKAKEKTVRGDRL